MFSEELNKLIEAAFVDGVLTDKERAVIIKRAKAEGIDPDEIELLLDAEVQKRQSSVNIDNEKDVNRLIDEISKIESVYSKKETNGKFGENVFKDDGSYSQKINEIVNAIRKFPIPEQKDSLIIFIKSMKDLWLNGNNIESIADAYKSKYLKSLDKAKSLYPDDSVVNDLLEKEKNEQKKFSWKRMSGGQQLLVFILGCIVFIAFIMVLMPDEDKEKSIRYDDYSSYQEAARAHDFEAAHKILDIMLERYHNKEIEPYHDGWFADNSKREKDKAEKEEMLKAYQEGVEYVFDAEVLFLCSVGDKASIDRLAFLMSDLKIEGNPITDGANYKYHNRFNRLDTEDHEKYIASVSQFNNRCDKLIDLAITNRNIGLANRIVQLYKPIPNQIIEDDDEHVMHYTNVDKERALEKVNKAIDDGVFPNVTEHLK